MSLCEKARNQSGEKRKPKQKNKSRVAAGLEAELAEAVVPARDKPDGPDWLDNSRLVEKALKICDWYQRCLYNPATKKGIKVADYHTLTGLSWRQIRETFEYFGLGPFPEDAVTPERQPGCESYIQPPRYVPPRKERYWI